MTRREATIRLLETRTVWHPGLRSQFATFGAVPGEKATKRTPCRSCDESGKLNTRAGLADCVKCDGRGWYLIDAYTELREQEPGPAKELSGSEREAWRHATDSKIAEITRQLARPAREPSTTAELEGMPPERWERERDRHYAAGDYRRLDLALEWASGAYPLAAQLACWTFEYGVLTNRTPKLLAAAHAAVDLVNTRMPEIIRVPHWLLPRDEASERYAARHAA